MGIYDRSNYGLGRYGPDLIATAYPGSQTVLPVVNFAYLLPDTNAQAQGYSSILVSWGTPDYTTFQTVTEFRLLSNPWGFPVDENDGTILLDITGAPPVIPVSYTDTAAVPGKLMYYGIYMLTGETWVRSGFAAELLPYNYGNGDRLLALMPEYYRSWGYSATQVVQSPVNVTPPPVPVSGQEMVNPYTFDVRVFLNGTFTGVTVNGVPLGTPQSFVLLGGGSLTLSYPFPVWNSANTYTPGTAVLSGGIAYVCTETVTSLTEPASDPLHWETYANSPYVPWTAGQSYNAGQIVTYSSEYYLVVYSVSVSTVAPPTDTVNFSLVNPSAVSWEWQEIPVSDTDDFLAEYLSILGYSMDIIRTQYDLHLNGLNNPMKMSLGDLQNFCAEIGMPFTAELPAYLMRKAALYWTQVMLERGTLEGIAEHVTLFSGYPVDLSISRNILLEDDISVPLDPQYPGWDANTKYAIGDKVTYPVADDWNILATYPVGAVVNYNGLLYKCVSESVGYPPTNTSYWDQSVIGPFTYEAVKVVDTLPGPTPSGSDTELDSTDTWQPIVGGSTGASTPVTESINIPPFITNGGLWETLTPAGTELATNIGVAYPNPLVWNTTGGSSTPVEPPQDDSHTFFGQNTQATSEVWMRYPARSEDDIINDDGNHVLDPELAVQHATPVPSGDTWEAATEYSVGDIVQYGNVFYVAQRGSLGAQPPVLDDPLGVDPWLQNEGETWGPQDGATTSWVTSPAFKGDSALEVSLTLTAAGSGNVLDTPETEIPVVPGAVYTITGIINVPETGEEFSIGIDWYDQFNRYLSANVTTVSSYTAGEYEVFTLTATAPVNAAYASRSMGVKLTAAGTASIYVGGIYLTCDETPEWAPLGRDNRLHLWSSAYTLNNFEMNPGNITTVKPFVEYYDDWGNFIARGISRQTSGYPANYAMDSFSVGVNLPVNLRTLDTGNQQWALEEGNLLVTPDLGVSAATAGTASIVTTTAPASGIQAVTFTNDSSSGHDQGLVFWYENNSNYWYVGFQGLYYCVSGTVNLAYEFPADSIGTGDRVYVWVNNTASTETLGGITVAGPSIVVWVNYPFSPEDQGQVLVTMSASPSSGQLAFPTSPAPYLPSTSATSSLSGIIQEVVSP